MNNTCESPKLTEKQIEYILKKLDKLITYVSLRISGDRSYSVQDYRSDIICQIMDAYIPGYCELNKITVDKINLEEKLFFSYLKACIWNYKNTAGKKINKLEALRKAYSLNDPLPGVNSLTFSGIQIEDKKDPFSDVIIKDILSILTYDERSIAEYILGDNTCLYKNGLVNLRVISLKLHKPYTEVCSSYASLVKKLRKNINGSNV